MNTKMGGPQGRYGRFGTKTACPCRDSNSCIIQTVALSLYGLLPEQQTKHNNMKDIKSFK